MKIGGYWLMKSESVKFQKRRRERNPAGWEKIGMSLAKRVNKIYKIQRAKYMTRYTKLDPRFLTRKFEENPFSSKN